MVYRFFTVFINRLGHPVPPKTEPLLFLVNHVLTTLKCYVTLDKEKEYMLTKKQCTHGLKVKCVIDGKEINDAKISIDEDGCVYICQNKNNGFFKVNDKLGYKYSWNIYDGDSSESWKKQLKENDVTLLERFTKTLRDVEVGDILVDRFGRERKVLGVLGELVFLSYYTNFDMCGYTHTFKELEEFAHTIDGQKEEKQELTLEEIAEKFNIPLSKLRIKEE